MIRANSYLISLMVFVILLTSMITISFQLYSANQISEFSNIAINVIRRNGGLTSQTYTSLNNISKNNYSSKYVITPVYKQKSSDGTYDYYLDPNDKKSNHAVQKVSKQVGYGKDISFVIWTNYEIFGYKIAFPNEYTTQSDVRKVDE